MLRNSVGTDVVSAGLKVTMNFDTAEGTLTSTVVLELKSDAFDFEISVPEQYEKLMEMWRGYSVSGSAARLGGTTEALHNLLDESSGRCPHDGYLGASGAVSVNAGNVRIAGTISGKYMCKDPGDTESARFSLSFDKVEKLALMDGALLVDDVSASIQASGAAGWNFKAYTWTVSVSGSVTFKIGIEVSMKGTVLAVVEREPQYGSVWIKTIEFDAIVELKLGDPTNPVVYIQAHLQYSYPCTDVIVLSASQKLLTSCDSVIICMGSIPFKR